VNDQPTYTHVRRGLCDQCGRLSTYMTHGIGEFCHVDCERRYVLFKLLKGDK